MSNSSADAASFNNQYPEVKGLVEDHWRKLLFLAATDRHKAQHAMTEFQETIDRLVGQFPASEQDAFLAAIDTARTELADEYDADPDALRARLGLASTGQQVTRGYQRQGIGEMAVRTAVRATIWEVIASLFRFR